MKMLKRLFILQFLFLAIIPITLAEITITLPEKDIYNLGEKIAPDVSVKQDKDYDGVFSLNILCDNYDLQYYTIPLSLEAGVRIQLTVPELSLSSHMMGTCNLKSNFKALDRESIDSASSITFLVTNKINTALIGDLESKPGKNVVIIGEAKKHSNEFLSKGEATISFNNDEFKAEVVSGKFEHTINLANDVKAGSIPITAKVTDKYGNYGDAITMFRVIPVPTRIENRFENNILMPGDNLKVRITLYDHTDEIMNESKISAKIFSPDEKLLAEKNIESLNYLEFQTEKTQIPGDYFLLSAFENIKEQNVFTIQAVRKISMVQEENFVHIENAGNIDYDGETTIILEKDNKKYLINKKIDLKPGEKVTIDLSKEVPQGTYDIILPEDAISESNTNQSGNAPEVAENVIKNVSIDDNRPLLKKTADGMSAVTGAVISTAGYIASKPALAATILILIILGTVARYSKDVIINKIKGKKKNDTSHLFKDFKFEERK